jgi:cytochrome P450
MVLQTDVIVDTHAINIDNPHWKDATTFDPHRHLGQKDSVSFLCTISLTLWTKRVLTGL